MNAYDKAWQIPGADGGVLVECGTEAKPYWWVLCPATACTFITEAKWASECAYSKCRHTAVHCEAARMIRERAGRQP